MKSLITHACTAAVCFVAGAVAAVLGLAFLVPDAPAATHKTPTVVRGMMT